MTSIINARLPCCVCGDPWTIDSPDYVTVTLKEPEPDPQPHFAADLLAAVDMQGGSAGLPIEKLA